MESTSFIHSTPIDSRLLLAYKLSPSVFGEAFRILHLKHDTAYKSFKDRDDFGPVNIACTLRFIETVDKELASFPDKKIVFCIRAGRRQLTNAVFLLGAYMILKRNSKPQSVADCFSWIEPEMLEPFRDATYSKPDFHLHLIDCWQALDRGKQHGWVRFAKAGYMWGDIDIDEYEHYNAAANGGMHEVVPGKLVAFKSPVDLGGADYRDREDGTRDFSPAFYAHILSGMRVSTVVRLSAQQYDAQAFVSQGFECHAFEFAQGARPPDTVVSAFFGAMDAAAGAVAVHSEDGLGRTGTLIALYLMRSWGFTAREAVGWLRIMRPGSIVGEQQGYLCDVEEARQALRKGGP